MESVCGRRLGKEGGFWWGGKAVKSIFGDTITLALKIRAMAFFKKPSRLYLHFRANSILFSSGENKHSCLPYVSFKIFAFQSLLSFRFQSC